MSEKFKVKKIDEGGEIRPFWENESNVMNIPELIKRANELNNQTVQVEGKLIQKIQDETFYLSSENLDLKLALADIRQKLPNLQENKLDEKEILESLNAYAAKIIHENPFWKKTNLIDALKSGTSTEIWKLFIKHGAGQLLEELSLYRPQLPYTNAISQLHSYLFFATNGVKDDYFNYEIAAEVTGRFVFEADYPKLLDIEAISLVLGGLRRYFFNRVPNLVEIKMSVDSPSTVEEILNNKLAYHQQTIRLAGLLLGHTSYENDFYLMANPSYGWLDRANRKNFTISVRSDELAKNLENAIGPFRYKHYNYLYWANLVGEIEYVSQQVSITNLKEFAVLTDNGIFHWKIDK